MMHLQAKKGEYDKVSKFNFVNGSIPLSRRKKKFKTYEDMMKCIDDERTVEEIVMTDFVSLSYDNETDIFHLEAEIEEDGGYDDVVIFDCPRYAIAQLCRDILGIGDIVNFIKSTQHIDNITQKDIDMLTGAVRPSRDNMDYLNEVLRNTWDAKRTKNSRTAKVLIYKVVDFATTSKDGDGRAIVTGRYIHKPDSEVMSMVKEDAEGINEDIRFANGYATALMTRASFVNPQPEVVDDKEVLLGVTCVNSEFKFSGLHLTGYLYIPQYDIELIGKTARLSISIKHIGDSNKFEQLTKAGINTVLGLNNEMLNLFSRVTTCESRGIALDFNAPNEKGSNALGVELGMSSKMADLLTIKEKKGYPSTIEGVALTLMDYSTHSVDNEAERNRVNQTIIRVLQQPDSFVASLGEHISRANLIDIDDTIEEPKDQNTQIDSWMY